MKHENDINRFYKKAVVNTNPKMDKAILNRILTTAFTKNIISDLTYRYILLFVFGILWNVMLISIMTRAAKHPVTTTGVSSLISILLMQFLLTITYTECRVGSLKKELLKKFGKVESIQSSEKKHNEAKNRIYKTIFVIIIATVTLGIVWYIQHRLMTFLK